METFKLVGIENLNTGYWIQNTITIVVNNDILDFDQKLKSLLLNDNRFKNQVSEENISTRLTSKNGSCICISGIFDHIGQDTLFDPCLQISRELQTTVLLSSYDQETDGLYNCIINDGFKVMSNTTEF
ncbi:hypothetical protein P3G55_16635 [Leptospira sp. 96542]|nr:hypothetical protein [Leptospira sp. 96542]